MKTYTTPTPAELADARQRFAEYELTAELTNGDNGAETARVTLSQIHQAASNPHLPIPAGIATAMLRHPGLRSVYKDLVARSSHYQITEARAASSDELPTRYGNGCKIRFEQARAEVGQVYVIIELDDPTQEPPTSLVFCDADNFCTSVQLQAWRNGVTQIIVDAESELLRFARDPKSTAFMR